MQRDQIQELELPHYTAYTKDDTSTFDFDNDEHFFVDISKDGSHNKPSGFVSATVTLLFFLAFLSLGVITGIRFGQDLEREQAMAAKVGRYIINEETGTKAFVYGP